MNDNDIIVAQDLNFDIYTKVFTGRQLTILATATFLIGIVPAMFIPNDLVKILLIALGLSIGYALAKMEVDGVILWDYLMLYYSYSKAKKVFIMGEFLPIKDIKDGLIYLQDGTVSSVFEITGVAYDMMSEASKAVVIQNIVELLYAVSGRASIYAWRKKYDISRDLEEIKKMQEKAPEYFASYKKMLLDTVADKQIGTVRYFIVFNGTKEEVENQGVMLMEIASKNAVFKVRRIYNLVPLLYAIMNLHRAYIQRVEEEEAIL